MKLLPTFLLILLISSCGKKGDGSNIGNTPLLPAPVSEPVIITEKDIEPQLETEQVLHEMLSEVGIRIEVSRHLAHQPTVIICINTPFTNEEKIEELSNYFITINDDSVPTKIAKPLLNKLIPNAIEALKRSGSDSRKCPKIYLAIE